MLTCPQCGVDSPRNDYQFCLNCGGDLEMRTVVRKAVVQTKRSSPRTLVAVASGILGLFIGSAIVISNVSQTVKSSSDANLKVANEAIAKISTPTPRPISVATPAETPAETPVETENSDNERQIVERRQSETANSLANARGVSQMQRLTLQIRALRTRLRRIASHRRTQLHSVQIALSRSLCILRSVRIEAV